MNKLQFNTQYSRKMLRMAEMLKTIAHPVRLDIIKLLGEHEYLNVSQIQERLDCGCEQSMLSHHLNKMKDKGILMSFKEGKFIHYVLANKDLTNIFYCIEKFDLK